MTSGFNPFASIHIFFLNLLFIVSTILPLGIWITWVAVRLVRRVLSQT